MRDGQLGRRCALEDLGVLAIGIIALSACDAEDETDTPAAPPRAQASKEVGGRETPPSGAAPTSQEPSHDAGGDGPTPASPAMPEAGLELVYTSSRTSG